MRILAIADEIDPSLTVARLREINRQLGETKVVNVIPHPVLEVGR